jgi:hypothetical protein
MPGGVAAVDWELQILNNIMMVSAGGQILDILVAVRNIERDLNSAGVPLGAMIRLTMDTD